MKKKETLKKFLEEIEIYYEGYYEGDDGFDNSDDPVAVIELAFKFYEEHRGKANETK